MTVQNQAVVAPAAETKADEAPLSLSQRIEKTVADKWQRAAAESTAEETPAAAEQQSAAPVGGEASAAEQPETETPAQEVPVTPEQLADPKFWGALDKAGWERMEREFPVETKHVKAAQAAASRIVNDARKTTAQQQPPAENANEQPTPKQPSAELKAAVERANSVDPNEAAEGLQQIIRLTLKDALPEFGIDPAAAHAEQLEHMAYATVVAARPDLAQIEISALNEAAIANPALLDMLQTAEALPDAARVKIISNVINLAADAVIAKKQSEAATNAAAIEKKKAAQAKVRSNANNPSTAVVDTPSGGAPRGKKPMSEFVNEQWQKATQNA